MLAMLLILFQTSSQAQLTFQKTLGGTGDEYANDIQLTSDSGYIIAGYTSSYGAGSDDVYLVKLNGNGDKP